MSFRPKVTLQINLSPGDYPHARYILPHQLNSLANQVDEIILTVETRPGRGRFSAGWREYRERLTDFLEKEISMAYAVKIIPVDYTAAARSPIADYFFGRNNIPDKDFRGGPFYAYFFGLYSATHDLVFHLDSDMLLGGGSTTWVAEAIDHLNGDPACFTVSPLPGPPHPDDLLIDQKIVSKIAPYTWYLHGMSTRIFLIDKSKLDGQKLQLAKPSIRNQIKALMIGHPGASLPEQIITAYMNQHQGLRIDFLGNGPGLWSLHPPYRTSVFYQQLPELITRIEQNCLPAAQRGFYDIIDELCDWSEAKTILSAKRWWKRKSDRS